ncbi:hypothetical protein [Endozoicomonas euniceicola]|uniref:Uncharacterized protein n=1 Tax=Endozoicomonas euniceicola TaxID=1234143 RepID=A0ABY6GR77_9GAMM|nr:hypothetical protein [Endozoicomonas euniceicola]UYM15062.1 hypothetical protein NX720_19645 [Endozoicomonas euniceicola]
MYDKYECLTDPLKISDTTFVPGSMVVDSSSRSGQRYFSGYVFVGSYKSPDEIFETGLVLTPDPSVDTETRLGLLYGPSSGATRFHNASAGVSSSICSHVAGWFFSNFGTVGYVYLVNATCFRGYASPNNLHPSISHYYPNLAKDICDVNFSHPISSDYIVGVVWPYRFLNPERSKWRQGPPEGLKITINPHYNGNKTLKTAEEVIALFC